MASLGFAASHSFGASRVAAGADPHSPICAVAEQIPPPIIINPRRPIKFAWSGAGVCTSSVPVALHRDYFDKHGFERLCLNRKRGVQT